MFFFYQCAACRSTICSRQYDNSNTVIESTVSLTCPLCKQTKNFYYMSQTQKFTPKQTLAFKQSNKYTNCIVFDVEVEATKK